MRAAHPLRTAHLKYHFRPSVIFHLRMNSGGQFRDLIGREALNRMLNSKRRICIGRIGLGKSGWTLRESRTEERLAART